MIQCAFANKFTETRDTFHQSTPKLNSQTSSIPQRSSIVKSSSTRNLTEKPCLYRTALMP